MKIESALLEIAEKDLQASRCLLGSKLYPHAVFFLQQAVEKVVKSYGIWSKAITETEAKEQIGHRSLGVYVKISKDFQRKLIKIKEASERFPKLKELSIMSEFDIDRLTTELEEFVRKLSEKDRTPTTALSEKELQVVVAEINKLRSDMQKDLAEAHDKIAGIGEKETEGFIQELFRFLDVFPQLSSTNIEQTKEQLKKALTPQTIRAVSTILISSLVPLVFSYVSLLHLSIIFSPHAVSTSYPFQNFNPLDFYNDRMPLVQMLPAFIRIVDETISRMKYLNSQMTGTN